MVAVFQDMQGLGVSTAVNLGDHFSGPLDALGTAEFLMAQDFQTIRGNHDRWLVEKDPSRMGPSDKVAHAQLNQTHFDWLRGLPPTLQVYEDIFLCHGTPKNDLTYWLEQVEPDGSVRHSTLKEIEAEAQGLDATLILCGHTHLPKLVRLTDGRTILNPGSFGCPGHDHDTPVHHVMQTGTPNASYAVVEKNAGEWLTTFRLVPYDASRMISLARSNGREEWARALARG